MSQEGAALVETAFASTVFLAFLFGIFQMSQALYISSYLSNASRQASRYAMVRGSTSCTNTSGLSNCNLTTNAQIQSYVQGLGYPGITNKNVTATITFLSASSTTPTTWTVCATACNEPGNLVKVVVSYTFRIHIPFSYTATPAMTSTSQMVISQ
jgi:Flp pilus assembly protein TadG